MSNTSPRPSPSTPKSLETIKDESNYLRGHIAAELAEPTDHFSPETAQLIKYHGMYQQDDRDRRVMLGDPNIEKRRAYQFMVRTGVPGGRLTSQQLLAHIELAEKYGSGSLRITSRQDLQIHGLAKANLRAVLKRIHEVGLTTLATAGDVQRNVVCCPAPYRHDPVHGQMQWMVGQIATALAPKTPAYDEIWLEMPRGAEARGDSPNFHPGGDSPDFRPSVNGTVPLCNALDSAGGDEVEPLYGKTYLPRKLKVGIGLPGDNCTDVYSQDIGLLAICRNYNVIGYNVLVGGGMGYTPAKAATFPALAQRMAYARADRTLDVVRSIVRVFRDFGDRGDRKHARLKYLVADWGLERFKQQVEQYLGYELPQPEPDDVWDIDDHLGWREQGDGRWFYGLHVPCGRIQDTADVRLKSALRDTCEGHKPTIYLTAAQNILLGDVYWEDRLHIEERLRHSGVKLVGEISNVRRWAAACVSLPTCPLALSEGERALPDVLRQLEIEVAQLGLQHDSFALRMTGCSNGCSRPYNADIGIVGRAAGRYGIYLGGRRVGNRLGFLYRDGVPLEQIVAALVPVLAYFKQQRHDGEPLGDFCYRMGAAALQAAVNESIGTGVRKCDRTGKSVLPATCGDARPHPASPRRRNRLES